MHLDCKIPEPSEQPRISFRPGLASIARSKTRPAWLHAACRCERPRAGFWLAAATAAAAAAACCWPKGAGQCNFFFAAAIRCCTARQSKNLPSPNITTDFSAQKNMSPAYWPTTDTATRTTPASFGETLPSAVDSAVLAPMCAPVEPKATTAMKRRGGRRMSPPTQQEVPVRRNFA